MQSALDSRVRIWTWIFAVLGPLSVFGVRILIDIVGDRIIVLFICGAILLVVFVAWAGLTYLDALALAVSAYQREWRRFPSKLILLLVMVVTGVNLGWAWQSAAASGDYVHLFALYPRYMAEISDLPEPRFKAWQWHFAGPCGSGIAYDESDAIASRHRSTSDGLVGTVDVHGNSRAFGHFYFATFC
jgi:hypothetical protein